MAERLEYLPTADAAAKLDGIAFIPSPSRERGSLLVVKAGAFMDERTAPAIIAHPADLMLLTVAIEWARPMTDLGVQFEATRRYLADLIDHAAVVANRRLNRMVDGLHWKHRSDEGEQ